MRKTFNVNEYRDKVNHYLAISTCNKDVRQGMIGVLESVLLDTGNYRGFRYLAIVEVPDGHLPGIQQADSYEEKFTNTDKTRVYYY